MKLKRVFSILFISTLTTMLFVGCNNLNQKAQKEEVIISADYYNYDTDDDLINNSDVIVEGKILNYKSEYLVLVNILRVLMKKKILVEKLIRLNFHILYFKWRFIKIIKVI